MTHRHPMRDDWRVTVALELENADSQSPQARRQTIAQRCYDALTARGDDEYRPGWDDDQDRLAW